MEVFHAHVIIPLKHGYCTEDARLVIGPLRSHHCDGAQGSASFDPTASVPQERMSNKENQGGQNLDRNVDDSDEDGSGVRPAMTPSERFRKSCVEAGRTLLRRSKGDPKHPRQPGLRRVPATVLRDDAVRAVRIGLLLLPRLEGLAHGRVRRAAAPERSQSPEGSREVL
jgi:hypothetical protein